MGQTVLPEAVAGQRMLVAGPIFDHRISLGVPGAEDPESVHLLRSLKINTVPGGAGRLARMLTAWGAEVYLAGFIGDDPAGNAIATALHDAGVHTGPLIVIASTSTPVAVDVLAGECLAHASIIASIRPEPLSPPDSAGVRLRDLCGQLMDTVDSVMVTAPVDAAAKMAMDLSEQKSLQVQKIPLQDVDSVPVLHPPPSGKARTIRQLQWMVQQVRDFGGRICFTNGCFDLLHAGHVTYLQEASEQADCFVLALNSDASISALKGPSRPILNEQERVTVLSALECVDYITVFDTENVIPLLDVLRPEVYVKGGDYTIDTINQTERRFIEGYGADIVLLSGVEGASTTEILRRIHDDGVR